MTSEFRWIAGGAALLVVAAVAAGCATTPKVDYDKLALEMINGSFRAQGQAGIDRLKQDEAQRICSGPAPAAADLKRIETAELATIKPPASGRYIGDWREGEKLAQNGRGMTWTDPAGTPAGGNCYNCHQMSKAEISFGTIGPSLYNYGKLRGVADPADPAAAPIVQYTWGKIWNAKAYSACSEMPRFGHAKVLSEQQIQDLMALLLDPKSPVNQ
ncbi:MAG: sulfur oxidation c-type cytochrome SoxX [Variovorax sp.]